MSGPRPAPAAAHLVGMARIIIAVAALLSFTACGGPPQAIAPEGARAHLGEAWFAFRAETLGISAAEARARDDALSDAASPAGLDQHTAQEAAVAWVELCAQCHGLDGAPPADRATQWEAMGQKVPRDWSGAAAGMGFAMGGDSMRAGLFRKISEGVPPTMPPWGATLSREQIWALIRHLEGF